MKRLTPSPRRSTGTRYLIHMFEWWVFAGSMFNSYAWQVFPEPLKHILVLKVHNHTVSLYCLKGEIGALSSVLGTLVCPSHSASLCEKLKLLFASNHKIWLQKQYSPSRCKLCQFIQKPTAAMKKYSNLKKPSPVPEADFLWYSCWGLAWI